MTLSPNSTDRRLMASFLVLVAAAGVAWYVTNSDPDGPTAERQNIPVRMPSNPRDGGIRLTTRTSTQATAEYDDAESGTTQIRVSSTDGDSLPEARVVSLPHGSLKGSSELVAAADTSGTVALTRSRLAELSPQDRLYVECPGFVGREIPRPTRSMSVILNKAHKQDVRIIDDVGRGVAGIRVALVRGVPLAQAHAILTEHEVDWTASDPTFFIRESRTDTNGAITFEDLPEGRCSIIIRSSDHWVGGDRGSRYVDVPAARFTANVVPAIAATYRFTTPPLAVTRQLDSSQLDARFRPSRSFEPGTMPGDLTARLPEGSSCIVAAGIPSVPNPTMRLRCLFERGDWQEFEVPFRSLEAALTPTLIKPEARSEGKLNGGRLRFRVEINRPLPADFEASRFYLGGFAGSVQVDRVCSSNWVETLPFGKFRIAGASAFFDRAFGTVGPIDFKQPDQEVVLTATRDDLQPCRIRFRDTNGQPTPGLRSIVLTHDCGWIGGYEQWNTTEATFDPSMHTGFLCPPGTLRVELECRKQRRAFEYEIRESEDVQIIDVVVDVPRSPS